jgi:NAD(P)-dependent dehydrogenase (short-subunit alcohol dehydrogenase family)
MFKLGSPLNTLGLPQDIAQAVAYLASDRAAYVTGTSFVIDGGYSLMTPMSATYQGAARAAAAAADKNSG